MSKNPLRKIDGFACGATPEGLRKEAEEVEAIGGHIRTKHGDGATSEEARKPDLYGDAGPAVTQLKRRFLRRRWRDS